MGVGTQSAVYIGVKLNIDKAAEFLTGDKENWELLRCIEELDEEPKKLTAIKAAGLEFLYLDGENYGKEFGGIIGYKLA